MSMPRWIPGRGPVVPVPLCLHWARTSRGLAGALLLTTALLQGCATGLQTRLPDPPLIDETFAPAVPVPAPEALLALSPPMRDFLSQTIEPQVRRLGSKEALLRSLYRDGRLQVLYDAEKTRTAEETFADGRGNCLSLVLMTAAFARELQVPLHFRQVMVDPQWTRSTNLLFQAGHVNLGLGTRLQERGFAASMESMTVVDFMPPEQRAPGRAVELREATIVAMFYNNRAAERLFAGDARSAYWWARAAVRADARYSGGFNTLAVLYRRQGRLDLAEQVLAQVLALEPDNGVALANMIVVMKEAQRPQEVASLEARLRAVQPVPPFHYFDAGVVALREGDYAGADAHFARELARSASNHELHFLIALAKLGLGDRQRAAQHLTLAAETSPTPGQQRLYEAKLGKLLGGPSAH